MSAIDIVIICIVAVVALAILIVSDRADRKSQYRGYDLVQRAKIVRTHRWSHRHCHVGSGSFCESCFAYEKCWEECKKQAKKEIDEWLDKEDDQLQEDSV